MVNDSSCQIYPAQKLQFLAIQLRAIQPEIFDYIARYIWLYSSQLYSQTYHAIQLVAIQPFIYDYITSYIWLYNQLHVAIQPKFWLYSQLKTRKIVWHIKPYCMWLYSQMCLAIQPHISGSRDPLAINRRYSLAISGCRAESYIDRYTWLQSQIYLAMQSAKSLKNWVAYIAIPPLAIQLSYIAQLYSQICLAVWLGAIQPDKYSDYIARAIWPHISGYIAESYIASKVISLQFDKVFPVHTDHFRLPLLST